MKATGIIRNIDELGRIVIPKKIRTTLDIQDNDPVEIYVEEDKIILKKYANTCIFCGESDNLTQFKGKILCQACKQELSL